MLGGHRPYILLLGLLSTIGVAATPIAAESPRAGSGFADDCPPLDLAPADPETEYRRRVVATSYCAILRRSPDLDGMTYWVGQLSGDLTPVGLVKALLTSPEYRQRSVRTFTQSFTALQPGSDLTDRPIRRRPMTAAAFDRWVDDRAADGAVDQVEPVTPAMVHATGRGVNVVYVHLSRSRGMRVSPGDAPRRIVGAWADDIGAHVAINGNWYAPYDGPAVSEGVVYGGDDHGYTALFGMTADNEVVTEHHRQVNDRVDRRVTDGVAGHPTLVDRGEPTTDFGGDPTFTRRHPRTAIGVDESGDVLILVTVDGRSTVARGMTGGETARLMRRLGAHRAVMLDGGGSTTMWIAGRGIVNQPSGRPRAVGNQVAVFGD